jgi:hypothetical protein
MKKFWNSPFLKLSICTIIGAALGYFLGNISLGIGIGFSLGIGYGFLVKDEE